MNKMPFLTCKQSPKVGEMLTFDMPPHKGITGRVLNVAQDLFNPLVHRGEVEIEETATDIEADACVTVGPPSESNLAGVIDVDATMEGPFAGLDLAVPGAERTVVHTAVGKVLEVKPSPC